MHVEERRIDTPKLAKSKGKKVNDQHHGYDVINSLENIWSLRKKRKTIRHFLSILSTSGGGNIRSAGHIRHSAREGLFLALNCHI